MGRFTLTHDDRGNTARKLRLVASAPAAALLALLWPAPAAAETTVEAAEAIFREGVTLMKAGACEQAIEKFRESERLDSATGTLLNLAYCQAQLGWVASAWSTYQRVIPLAHEQQKSEHEQLAREQAAELEAQLPHLSVKVVAGHAPLRLSLDGEPLPNERWNSALPVDPGVHEIVATFAEGRSWSKTITLGRGEKVTLEIPPRTQPALGPAAREPISLAQPVSVVAKPVRATPSADPKAAWGIALAVTGGGSLVAGGVMLAVARAQYDAAAQHCQPRNRCQEPYYGDERDAIRLARWGGGLAAGGAVLLGVGAVLVVTGKQSSPSGAAGTVVVGGSPASWALGWRRAW